MYQNAEITEDLIEIVQLAVKVATVVVAAGGAILAALDNTKTLSGGRNNSKLKKSLNDYFETI